MNNLTENEIEILKMILCGMNNLEISKTLGFSLNETKELILALYAKFDVNNRISLALKIAQNNDVKQFFEIS